MACSWPGYEVTRTDEMDYSPTPEGPSLAVLARRRCRRCLGECRVRTPEWQAWAATRSAVRDRALGAGARDAEAVARNEAGQAPENAWEECTSCEGRGWNEIEVSLRELARELIDLFRVKGKRLELRRKR